MIEGELYKLKNDKDMPKLVRYIDSVDDNEYQEILIFFNLSKRKITKINLKDFNDNYELIKENILPDMINLLSFKLRKIGEV